MYIKTIVSGGAAERDGTCQAGDMMVCILRLEKKKMSAQVVDSEIPSVGGQHFGIVSWFLRDCVAYSPPKTKRKQQKSQMRWDKAAKDDVPESHEHK